MHLGPMSTTASAVAPPPQFNFGTHVVDRHAGARLGEALVWEGPDGRVERYTYADMARLPNRFGDMLHGLGVGKGGIAC